MGYKKLLLIALFGITSPVLAQSNPGDNNSLEAEIIGTWVNVKNYDPYPHSQMEADTNDFLIFSPNNTYEHINPGSTNIQGEWKLCSGTVKKSLEISYYLGARFPCGENPREECFIDEKGVLNFHILGRHGVCEIAYKKQLL